MSFLSFGAKSILTELGFWGLFLGSITLLQINMEVEGSPFKDYYPPHGPSMGFHVYLGEGTVY